MNVRVLHVLESCGAGGIETTFLNMLRQWRNEPPWATHHVLAFAGGSLEGTLRDVAGSLTIAAAQDDQERALLVPYDAVHFLFERCAYRLLPFVLARTNAAVVCGKGYDMAGMFRLNDGLRWQADESMLWGADGVTFTTTDLASGYNVPADRAAVLGKAADIQSLMSLPLPDLATPPRIVCVANLHARKRLGDLITAVARLRADFPEVCVRFVGADDGREAARLGAMARGMGVESSCEFVGFRAAVADVAGDIAVSRLFALPSACEGVPTAMLEAMAAGRPVVMTDVGHIRSVVREGVDGFLVPAGDVDALTDRLRWLLADPARAARMGAEGRTRARGHDVHAVAASLKSAMERACSGALQGSAA